MPSGRIFHRRLVYSAAVHFRDVYTSRFECVLRKLRRRVQLHVRPRVLGDRYTYMRCHWYLQRRFLPGSAVYRNDPKQRRCKLQRDHG